MRRKLRLLAVVAVMAVLATGAYAFTAANTVPATNAGFGAGSVSGYDVSNIHYTHGADNGDCGDNPSFGNCIIGVSFDLTPKAPGTAQATQASIYFDVPDPGNLPPHLYSTAVGGGCTITPGPPAHVDCTIAEYAAGVSQIRIAAVQ